MGIARAHPPGRPNGPNHTAPEGLEPLPPELSPASQESLVRIVRAAILGAVGAHPDDAAEAEVGTPAELLAAGQAFVTLTEDGQLRGCMGSVAEDVPLAEAVASAARSAARYDPRFRPVAADELARLEVELSVMGTPVPLGSPDAFRPGIDGLIMEQEGRRALFLPEVATMMGWGTVEMLSALARKAGLAPDAWRRPGTRLFVFRTVRFEAPLGPRA